MNVYLSMVKTNEMDNNIPPYSLLVLASVVENAGHNVKIIFPVELDEFLSGADNLRDCDVFGLSCNSFNWHATRKVISKIHSYDSGIIICMGGPHPTFFHQYCLESTLAHIVVRNEGEVTFPAVLEALQRNASLQDIPGITYKTGNDRVIVNESRPLLKEIELDQMPLPAYHLIPPGLYKFVPMETSRGCVFNCIFCGIPFTSGYRCLSSKKVARVLNILNNLTDRFSAKAIFLTDDSFTTVREHTIEILKLINEINPEFSVGCEARITEIIKNDLVRHFERVNVFLMQVGVECGYEEGLKTIRKGLTIKDISEFANLCVNTSFHYQIYWSFIIGFPWEREEHVLKTINFAFNCTTMTKSQQPQINNFSPFPGSEIFENYERYGLSKVTSNFYDNPGWFTSFLKHTKIPAENRDFIFHYFQQRHQRHPNFPWTPFIYLPNGTVLDNRLLQ